jgi:Helix-turn-helix domain
MEKDRIAMSQRERDVLKVMELVLGKQRTQVEAGRLLGLCTRQIRRIVRRLESEGDAGVVHRLRGRPSNRARDPSFKRQVLAEYQAHYGDFGPTLAAAKLSKDKKLAVSARTLSSWLVAAGLWQRKRHRDRHRSRRERRACFGEMVQADASEHDWLEGRGDRLVLVGMIDDASSQVMVRFYRAETTEAYMDLLKRWLKKHGRPLSWYSDWDSVFVNEDASGEPVTTNFSRALSQLQIELILANSPQAKGRIERLWNTAQDRLVKELRLAKASTLEQANAVVQKVFVPWFNRSCTIKPLSGNDAHRPLDKSHDLASILSVQEQRTVANDYTIRYHKETWQLHPPVWPGQRGGQVTIEQRLDGSMAIRFREHYLKFKRCSSGALPPNPRLVNLPRQSGSSGRGKACWRPASNHPWRGTIPSRPRQADIPKCRN